MECRDRPRERSSTVWSGAMRLPSCRGWVAKSERPIILAAHSLKKSARSFCEVCVHCLCSRLKLLRKVYECALYATASGARFHDQVSSGALGYAECSQSVENG